MTEPPEPPDVPLSEPYALVFAAIAEVMLPGLPAEARSALADALDDILWRPWSGARYHPRMPVELRTTSFGAGRGILQWVTSPKQQRVIVTQILWAGYAE